MKNKVADSAESGMEKQGRRKQAFDWWLFSFITIVIILLVVLLSYR